METGGLQILADGHSRFNVDWSGNHSLPSGIHLAEAGSLEPGPAPGISRPGFRAGSLPIRLFKNRPEKYRPALPPDRQMLHFRLPGLEKLSSYYFYDDPRHHIALLAVPQTFSRRSLCHHRRRIVPFELSLLPPYLDGKNQETALYIFRRQGVTLSALIHKYDDVFLSGNYPV